MKIVIVAPEAVPVPSVLGGSVEICIWAIAKRLAEQHQVTVISRRHPRYPNRTVQGNLNIVRVPTGTSSRYLRAVLSEIKNHHFDVIQVDNRPRFVGPLKKMFPDKTVSLFLHSLTFVSTPRISRKDALSCLSKADLIVSNSSSLKRELSQRFPELASKIHRVWLGVDTNRFSPAAPAEKKMLRRRLGLGSAYSILYAGRLIPRKGIPVLMHAVHLVRAKTKQPVQLVIAGGPFRKSYLVSLRELDRKLRLKTHFLGIVPHSRMHQVYRLADCFVCPSQGHESFGLVNVEAMASGLPVIAANNGGMKEIIRHASNGLLVPSYRSPSGYAKAIVKLMNSSELAKQLAAEGRRTAVEQFNWGMTAENLERLYSKSV